MLTRWRSLSRVFATLALASPVIANEENIKEATTFSEERRLIARINQEQLPTPAGIPMFAAVWASIAIDGSPDACLTLEIASCCVS